MPTLRTRASKGSELSHNELDANFARTVTQKTTTYQVLISDNRSVIEGSHASTPFTITLPPVATADNSETGDFEVTINNINLAVVSVDGSGSETINGSTLTVDLNQWDSIVFRLDSAQTGWVVEGYSNSPAGGIVMWASATAPAGWLHCDGSTISRTTYSRLFAVIADVYGVGDGSTTFEIPDLQGQFVRGWDNGAGTDPDAASRTDSGDGSTTGDNVGTKQVDAFKAHDHDYTAPTGSGLLDVGDSFDVNIATLQTSETGGAETRPVNVYLMYIIKV